MRFPRPVAVLVVLAALAAAPFASAAPRNLLQNPGFESGRPDHPWLAAAWDTSASELPTVFFGRDTLLAHTGSWAVSVANLSTRIPVAHNWSQTVVVGREAWGKDLVFSVWTRSNGLRGRAYVLAQAYRDTASKMAVAWKVDRDEALRRLGINKVDDPLIDFGWARQFFVDEMTDWVRREVRVFVAPSTNVIFVRAGSLGARLKDAIELERRGLRHENSRRDAAVVGHHGMAAVLVDDVHRLAVEEIAVAAEDVSFGAFADNRRGRQDEDVFELFALHAQPHALAGPVAPQQARVAG